MKLVVYILAGIFSLVIVSNLWRLSLNVYYRHFPLQELVPQFIFFIGFALIVFFGVRYVALSSEVVLGAHSQVVLEFFKIHKTWLICALVASLLGLITMGAFGIGVMTAFDFLLNPLVSWKAPHGDTTWPTAILYSIIAPWIMFSGMLLLRKLTDWSSLVALNISAAGFTVVILAILQLIYRWANK